MAPTTLTISKSGHLGRDWLLREERLAPATPNGPLAPLFHFIRVQTTIHQLIPDDVPANHLIAWMLPSVLMQQGPSMVLVLQIQKRNWILSHNFKPYMQAWVMILSTWFLWNGENQNIENATEWSTRVVTIRNLNASSGPFG
jgi:hypothetical protein